MGDWSPGSVGSRSVSNMPNQVDGVDIANSSTIEALRDILLSTVNWNYLPVAQPSGMATAAQLTYQFDGSASQLNDRTGNGHNLTLAAGAQFNSSSAGMVGLGFVDTTRYESPYAAALAITGAITIEAVFMLSHTSGNQDTLIAFRGTAASEAQADNALWDFKTTAAPAQPLYVSENGGGSDSNFTFNAIVPVGQIVHGVITRDGSGNVVYYENGESKGGGATTTPDGGTNAILVVGAEQAAQPMGGIIFSLKVTPAQFSAAQVLESYQKIRGLIT